MSKSRILIRLIKYTANYKGSIAFLIGLGCLHVGLGVLQPLPMKYIIDHVLSDHPVPPMLKSLFAQVIDGNTKSDMLGVLIVATVIIVLLNSIFSFVSTHVTTRICQRLVHDFSEALFNKLQKLSLAFYSKNNVGDLMQRISDDTYVIYSIVGGIMIPTLTSVASLGAMFYIMYSINSSLALMAISIVPLFALLLYVFNKPMTNSTTRQYEISGKMWSFIQQSLSSVKIIQAYTRENFTRKIFSDHSLAYKDASVHSTKVSMVYNELVDIVAGIATATIVGIGAYKGLNGVITIGELFLFISYIGALFGPVSSLAGIIATSFTVTARAKRVFEVLDSEEEIYEKPDAIVIENMAGRVELKNVSFGYGKEGQANCILHDFNLVVEAGKMIAVVGPTGAGKTSMISLLLRFYDPWSGEVLIDDRNVKDLTLQSLRSNISLVLQDSFIFPISIADNIAFGNPLATRDEIIAAAKAAQAHTFIMRLPEGYETVASEGGVSLSGGEKQRISLARAFLRNTPILILDEPTSAMDVQTEAKIFKALASYTQGRTVFIISHRLSTIRHADLILTIRDGRIEEQGTHDALVNGDKIYSELYKYQKIAQS